jgi:predicted acyl esterase
MQQAFKSPLHVEETQFSSFGTLADAQATWEAQPHLRALFESGAGYPQDMGAPMPTFELALPSWPPPGQTPQRWYFQPDGTMAAAPPKTDDSASSFQLDPQNGERGNLAPGGDVWDKLPAYDWQPPAANKGVAFESPPLAADEVMMGNGSVDLSHRSTADDADLEVNLVEVRPDGKEMYVQSGWLRASYAKPGPDATELWPAQTFEQQDWAPLVPGQWTEVRVGFAGFQHVFRAGSKIRVFVNTPGGSRAAWRFALKTFDTPPTHTIGHDSVHPSSVVLPVLTGVTAPSPLPPCPSLRGQPCRDYAAFKNTRAE